MKKDIKIEVYSFYWDATIPEKADEFFAFWKEKVNLVPEEYRNTTRIEIGLGDDYGHAELNATVSFTRPETGQEEAGRERRTVAKDYWIRREELAQLAKLKEKYGETE